MQEQINPKNTAAKHNPARMSGTFMNKGNQKI